MKIIDKEKFYKEYRKTFGYVKQSVVDCCDAIINEFNSHPETERDIEKKAYMLATVRHEVGPAMIPIVENMSYSAKRITEVWPSRFKSIKAAQPYAHNPQKLANNVYGNRLGNGPASTGDGYRYRGRGIGAQFTGKVNYEKFSKIFGVDLVNHPELAVDLKLGAKILYKGSMEGLFTGVGLGKYINNKKVDYVNARRVINDDVGRNGAKIAKDAKVFEGILRNSVVNASVRRSEEIKETEKPVNSTSSNTSNPIEDTSQKDTTNRDNIDKLGMTKPSGWIGIGLGLLALIKSLFGNKK